MVVVDHGEKLVKDAQDKWYQGYVFEVIFDRYELDLNRPPMLRMTPQGGTTMSVQGLYDWLRWRDPRKRWRAVMGRWLRELWSDVKYRALYTRDEVRDGIADALQEWGRTLRKAATALDAAANAVRP